jgi:hypothetical protein
MFLARLLIRCKANRNWRHCPVSIDLGRRPGPLAAVAAAGDPLVVDIEGTLRRSESFLALLSAAPLAALLAIRSLWSGNAAFKTRVAAAVEVDVGRLPWNGEVLDLIATEQARAWRVYLASASNHRLVELVAEHLGPFDGAFASTDRPDFVGRSCHFQDEACGNGSTTTWSAEIFCSAPAEKSTC